MENLANLSFRDLSNEDLLRVAKVCEQLHMADPGESFVVHCQQVMESLFSHVHFSAELQQIDPFIMLEKPNNTVDEQYLPLFYAHVHEHPVVDRLLNTPKSEIYVTQYETAAHKFKKSALYNEFYTQVESHNQIITCVVDNNQLLLSAYSRDQEYTEGHRAMAHLIQPHLELAWKHWKKTRSLNQKLGVLKDAIFQSEEEEAAAAQLRRMIDDLPNRQREVVELVAAGLDNQQIADELNISKRTVQKHLELIFQSLDVHHRTELAAKWHKAHSVQVY